MNNKKNLVFIFSLLLHSLILLKLPNSCNIESEATKAKRESTNKLKEQVEDLDLNKENSDKLKEFFDNDFKEFIAKQKEPKKPIRVKLKIGANLPKPSEPIKCDNYYIGLGFTHGSLDLDGEGNEVLQVAPDYPAYNAGLRVGDKVLGVLIKDKLHHVRVIKQQKEGTYLALLVKRDEDIIKLRMKVSKICYEKDRK